MKKILILLLALLLCMSTSQETMAAEGWPANCRRMACQLWWRNASGILLGRLYRCPVEPT